MELVQIDLVGKLECAMPNSFGISLAIFDKAKIWRARGVGDEFAVRRLCHIELLRLIAHYLLPQWSPRERRLPVIWLTVLPLAT